MLFDGWGSENDEDKWYSSELIYKIVKNYYGRRYNQKYRFYYGMKTMSFRINLSIVLIKSMWNPVYCYCNFNKPDGVNCYSINRYKL